nr:DUF4347 domain-containing protein [Halomonas sp.]|tara:strand:+ start:8923 stop:14922 length:6000 start_codon:yes stop_codon:yes gene_type:complete
MSIATLVQGGHVFNAPKAGATSGTRRVVFIDSEVADYEALIRDIDDDTAVHIVPGSRITIPWMTEVLSRYSHLESLHIVCHGSEGQLTLGQTELTLGALYASSQELSTWGKALSETADILLYGCCVAAGQVGSDFLAGFADLTGKNVAGSTTVIGTSGDWVLDRAVGAVTAGSVFSEAAMASYSHDLATVIENNPGNAYSSALTNATGVTFSQSFTATASGDLTSIAVVAGEVGGNVTLNVYSGDGVVGGSLTSQTFTVSVDSNNQDYHFQTVALNSPISVTNGSIYTFELRHDSGSFPDWGMEHNGDAGSNGDYTGGIMYADGAAQNDFDLYFQATITPSNNAPAFSNLNATPSYIEGDAAVLLDADATIADTELDALNGGNGDYSGASLAIARNGGANAEDSLGFDTSGAGFTVSGSNLQSGGLTFATYTQSGGALTINFTSSGTVATTSLVNDVLQRLTYQNGSDAPPGSVTLDYTLSDGTDVASGTNQITVGITPTNDAPTASDVPTDVTVTEDTASNFDLSTLTLTDVDGDSLTVTLAASAGTFTAASGGGVTVGGSGTGSLTLAGSAADINTYLDTTSNVQYTGAANVNGNDAATFTLNANDGTVNPQVGSGNIDIAAVNDAPVFVNLDATPSYTEGGTAVVLDADVTIADIELDALNGGNGNYSGASLAIARHGGANAEDSLGFDTSGASFTVSGGDLQSGGQTFATYTQSGGALTINFTSSGTVATTSLVNDVLQRLTYQNGSDAPSGSVTLDYTLSDGTDVASGTNQITVGITPTNDAPTVSNLPAGIAINEDQPGNLDISASSLVDPDSASISVTLAVSAGTIGLANPSGYSVTASGNGTSSVVLTGSASNINSYLDTPSNVIYTPAQDVNGVGAATLSLSVNDNDGSGDVSMGSVPINITAVNDAPSVSGVFGDTSSQVTAGSGAVNVTGLDDATLSNIDSSDYNGGALTLAQNTGTTNGSWGLDGIKVTAGGDGAISAGETIAVGGTNIGTVDGTSDGQGGSALNITLNANATDATIQQLIRALTYEAPSGLGDRSFTLELNDGDGTLNGGDATSSGSFTIAVTPNPPVLSGLDGDSVTFTEAGAPVRLDMGGNATVSDVDSTDFNGGALTVSIAGGAAAGEDILSLQESSDGRLTLVGSELFWDDDGNAGTAAVKVADVSGGTNGADLVLSLTGAAKPGLGEALDAMLSNLAYQNTSDTPSETSREVSVTVRDAAGGNGAVSATSTVTVGIQAVNDAPVFTGVDATPSFIEGGSAVVLDGNATIADPELDAANGGAGNYAGATLTLARQGGKNADDGFFATGKLGALTEGGDLDVGATTIGTVTTNSGGMLTLTFNGNATSARVNSALQQIAYANGSDVPPASAEIAYRFSDGNSGAQGSGGALADADDSVTVTLVGVNDAPVFTTPGKLSMDENTTAVTTLAATDAEGDTLVYSITGGADAALFSLDANSGALTFTGAPDFESPKDQNTDNVYEVTVAAADGTDQTAHTLAVTVTNVEETSPSPDPDPSPGPIQVSEPVSQPDMPSGLPSVSETIINTGNTPGSTKLVENSGNANEVTATLPGGVSLVNQGARSAVDAQQALADLIGSIDAKQPGNLTDQTGVASQWLASRPGSTLLDIRTLVLNDSGSASTNTPILITGIVDDAASDHQEAFVIDASALPSGNRIQLDNIDFASIIGATTLSGGAGNNVVSADDAAQTIVLGAGDDELHGGGGRDLVGSQGGDDLIYGDAGDDRLFGGEGDDTLDGGSGVDIARFALDAGEATFRYADDGSLIVNAGSLGSDTLKGIELLRFDDRVMLAKAPALIEPSGFDEAFYLAANPDVAAAVAAGDIPSGEWHYQHYGADEGRLGDPAAMNFDRALYLAANPDVAAAVAAGDIDAFAHYRDYGTAEGRSPNALFDERGYREANADVDAAIQRGELDSGYQHYQAWGWQEGRDPSAWFDQSEYLEANPDIAEASVEPLGHYLRSGYDEGRVVVPADDGLWG